MAGAATKLRMGVGEWGLLAALALLWAGSFLFFKVLVVILPPLTVVAGRVLIAAAVLNAAVLARGGRLPAAPRLWVDIAVMGLLNNVVPFSLIAFGETQVSSGVASILNATTPFFTVAVAQAATADEKLEARKLAGLLLGLCGVAVLVGPSVLSGIRGADLFGEAAVLGAALSYGLAGVFGRRFAGLPPLTVATAQLTASSAVLLPLCLAVDRPWTLPAPGPAAWASLLCLAVFSTAVAYVLFFRILGRAGATNVSLVTMLVPVGAVLLGAAALGESLPSSALLGMAVVGLGLACLDGRAVSWLWRGRPA